MQIDRTRLLVLVAGLGMGLSVHGGIVQAAAPAAAGSGDALDEVIVTAERHEESAQKTAISMSVYSAAQISEAGVHDVQSLASIDPSINFTASAGAGYVAMRGVASTDLTEIGDPAVSIARDGFFTNRSYSVFSSFYDVARIEVLKGPQGTDRKSVV